MGLDGVELVMAVEETFGISISDADAGSLVTPGMLIDCVAGKLKLADQAVCQSQRAFYLLRRAFMAEFGLMRQQVTLDTPLCTVFPLGDIVAVWIRIKEKVQARSWPSLSRPTWMQAGLWCLFWLGLAGGAAGWFLVTWSGLAWMVTWPVASIIGVVVGTLLYAFAWRLTRSFQVCLPSRLCRVRDLVMYAESSERVEWSREGIARRMKVIIIEQLGIKEAQYREDAHFIKDLGMG